jgi:NADPH-dependent 2,4-dienoyl-CoA reductase/sulfur reductase-like enzyme/peroxiredoxin family protein/TusA-related sulfurtransferase/rhodanese-related sulfurtransferase
MLNPDEMKNAQNRIVVVGGVAGGASAAARARRLDEHASIVVLERGGEASFANCGLPYYIGNEIANRSRLLVAGDRQLKGWLNLDVRTKSEVMSIDREKREVEVQDLDSGRIYRQPYDYLVLSTGAAPIRPAPLLEKVGQDHPRVLSLRNMTDADRIKSIVDDRVKSVVVIGGGFIGLEVAEQIRHREVQISVVEGESHVMPPFDAEMAEPIQQQLRKHGVELHLGEFASGIEPDGDGLKVVTSGGTELSADLVLLAIGVRPDTALAKAAGLEMTQRGAVHVDAGQQTSDPRIFAVGDAVEVTEPIFGGTTYVPLGGPANRQGRLAADQIASREDGELFRESDLVYRGTQGTSIVRVFEIAAGMTGISEKGLARLNKRRGQDYDVVYAHPNQHASYFPGATPIALKLIFEIPSGRVLGAQATGRDGIDKRIDVIATAIQMNATVFDLAQAELCYAPPFGSAKDPVNEVGFMACNTLSGLATPIHVADLPDEIGAGNATLLDVRTAPEFAAGAIPGAVHLPLEELRDRIGEVPAAAVIPYCKTGHRGYYAERILKQNGYSDVRNLSGGYTTWNQFHATQPETADAMPNLPTSPRSKISPSQESPVVSDSTKTITLDACGLQCPGPLMAVADKMASLPKGARLQVVASDPGFPSDIGAWCRSQRHTLLESTENNGRYTVLIQSGVSNESSPVGMASNVAADAGKGQTIVVFSGDLDRVLASFVIANGAAAMGHPVTMFFTFWGLTVLCKEHPPSVQKTWVDRMFGWMLPRGADDLGLSKMNMAGLGSAMMKSIMREKGVASLPQMIEDARRQGVKMIACTMSMEIMGIQREELIDGLKYAGVGTYIGDAEAARMNLFI